MEDHQPAVACKLRRATNFTYYEKNTNIEKDFQSGVGMFSNEDLTTMYETHGNTIDYS